jgi:hypothetical protein
MLKIGCKRPSRAHLCASTNLRNLAFYPWPFRIGVNQALTCLRPNKKSFLFSDTAGEDSLRSLDPAGICPDPELQYQGAELSIRVLPPSFQPAFEMRYLRELSNEEAAVALDMRAPAIKTGVCFALAAIFANAQHGSMGLPEVNERASRAASGAKHDVAIVSGGLLGRLLAWLDARGGLGVALDATDRPGDPVRVLAFLSQDRMLNAYTQMQTRFAGIKPN